MSSPNSTELQARMSARVNPEEAAGTSEARADQTGAAGANGAVVVPFWGCCAR